MRWISCNNLLKTMWRDCSHLLISLLLLASGSLSFAQQDGIDPQLRQLLSRAFENSPSFVDEFDAQVWLVPRSTWLELYIDDPQERVDLLTAIHAAAVESNLDPDLVMSVIEIESGFDPFAISRSGAQGLMQVMPFWKNEIGRPEDNLTDINTNLRYGCAILAYYLNMESGDLEPALARYNGSYGQDWYSDRVLTALAKWP